MKDKPHSGKFTAVTLPDATSSGIADIADIAAHVDALEGIRQGLADSEQGPVRPVTEFFAEFEARHHIPHALP